MDNMLLFIFGGKSGKSHFRNPKKVYNGDRAVSGGEN
jgi:hypothetical protein